MVTFSRSQLIGAEFVDEETMRFQGIQDDHIYSMEVNMDVDIASGKIKAIDGIMKRYTTPVCPKAVEQLQNAVGMSLRDEGWMSTVMKEIGRKGCEHFAEIINECGRCLDQARMSRDLTSAYRKDPNTDIKKLADEWVKQHPEVQGPRLVQG